MQVHFSTDGLPPRERVMSWCEFFAEQAHHLTPGDVPDGTAFKAEASGYATGLFALLEIQSGLASARRTAADIARDQREAFFIRRFRGPAVWKAGPKSTPVDLVFEPGDFCVSSYEWHFEEESKGGSSFGLLVIPRAGLSPLLRGGRLMRLFL
jgi:hypothetical protein